MGRQASSGVNGARSRCGITLGLAARLGDAPLAFGLGLSGWTAGPLQATARMAAHSAAIVGSRAFLTQRR